MRACLIVAAFLSLIGPGGVGAPQPAASWPSHERFYFPAKGEWEKRPPAQLGVDEALLAAAVEWARTQETQMPRDFLTQEEVFGRPLGPVPKTRALTNGIILRRGYIIAEWGDTGAVDPTYSCAKSYLSTLLGLAIDRGIIPSIDDPVGKLIHDGGYDSEHNAKITWAHHATQTSEWDGSMFGKVHTFLGREEFGREARQPRDLHEPGSFYEYNDVRVNRMSLSLLRVWKRPLPEVLKSEIMDPIGGSDSWVYHGYANSTVDIDGKPMVSVSGGTRWGGGLWMSTRDHARFGLLMMHKGEWDGRRLISEKWIDAATSPKGKQPGYGYLWWLNSEGRWPDAPRSSFAAQGAGNNTIWIDPEHELILVWRWHRGDAQAELLKRIVAAVNAGSK